MLEVTAAEFFDMFHVNPALRVVDIREESEVAEMPINPRYRPIQIPRGVLERDISKHCPSVHEEIILVCQGGMRSAMAARTLVSVD